MAAGPDGVVVGRVARLCRFPVKSMAGEDAAELDLRRGIVRAGDSVRFLPDPMG